MRASKINGWNRLNIAFRTPPVVFTIDERAAAAADWTSSQVGSVGVGSRRSLS